MSVAAHPSPREGRGRRALIVLPLILFMALAVLFLARLWAGDPSRVPSALLGRAAPFTDLPAVDGLLRDGKAVPGFSNASLEGNVSVVNVWASWCAECHDEAGLLVQMSQNPRIQLVGINYKDQPDNARRFLGRYGNPFVAVGADASGRTSIDWGVYGVPETFVVDRQGRIVFKLVGPITPSNYETQIKPAIDKALAGS